MIGHGDNTEMMECDRVRTTTPSELYNGWVLALMCFVTALFLTFGVLLLGVVHS